MIKHIGITIGDSTEIQNFYQNILGMNIVKQFTISSEESDNIFRIRNGTDVFLMNKEETYFEIFIHKCKKNKNYNHICLEVENRAEIVKKAKAESYSCKIIEREDFDLVFVSDKSGNVFEIKEAEKSI
jgi:catechol 2,3-dioxygenase-like lactoylglutathione lyase family enzyme